MSKLISVKLMIVVMMDNTMVLILLYGKKRGQRYARGCNAKVAIRLLLFFG
ncbi:hypothetical protein T231_16830 [Tannerella sp. oral taxon BU063 isolate Cell 6/7/9]|uniref:Uncharacterized protein n=2 Tax=Tannerella serpentiformis TaxID=712710 RepID=W2CK72_9BACT|nr:hypothetical protein T231_16830 [Tannerella sp. oral taxon BU063 isolate Cell 6/7/9]